MFKTILRFFTVVFWWLVVIACIAVVGFILYPLFSDKSASLRTGNWGGDSETDVLQTELEGKTRSFLDISTTATSDVLIDQSGKRQAQYVRGEDGVFRPE